MKLVCKINDPSHPFLTFLSHPATLTSSLTFTQSLTHSPVIDMQNATKKKMLVTSWWRKVECIANPSVWVTRGYALRHVGKL